MRRIRARHPSAGHAPPAHQRLAVSRPVAGVPAAVMMVLAALAVLAAPASTPTRPGAADPPMRAVVSGSLAAFQPAVLPVGDPDGGTVTAARPHPAPTAVHALMASALTASGHRQQHGQPPVSRPARRPSHRAAGGPRAPPAALRPS
jgi:hypothetical protein